MGSRVAVLKRLLDVYGTLEDIHAAELQQAKASVLEVQHAISRQEELAISAKVGCREALAISDAMAWRLSELVGATSRAKLHELSLLCMQREELRDTARRQHAVSRTKSSQMEWVVSVVEKQIAREDERRLQATLDDRFAARCFWKNQIERKRPDR